MQAKITVVSGAVRIFTDETAKTPTEVAPIDAPYEVELDGVWSVGSASGGQRGNRAPGEFEVEALEAGELKHYQLTLDPVSMAVMQTTESVPVYLAQGESRRFATHDSNAYTVTAEALADLSRRK